jgi:putative YphP/YqiW family bacilliredoxin
MELDMPYSEMLIAPMREDLTRHGLLEARTAAQVDEFLRPGSGTVLMVTNSVCGCAAGKARPGVAVALQNTPNPPSKAVTVFAGADVEAVDRLRNHYLADIPPSSPSVALFKDGRPVWALHRHQIEGRDPISIARDLMTAFDQHCAPVQSAIS